MTKCRDPWSTGATVLLPQYSIHILTHDSCQPFAPNWNTFLVLKCEDSRPWSSKRLANNQKALFSEKLYLKGHGYLYVFCLPHKFCRNLFRLSWSLLVLIPFSSSYSMLKLYTNNLFINCYAPVIANVGTTTPRLLYTFMRYMLPL